MRKVILGLTVSLDGYIEGPNGEFDWCFTDQDYGMTEFFRGVDAMFIGRKSYELLQRMSDTPSGFPVLTEYVFSNTLDRVKDGAYLLNGDIAEKVLTIKQSPGKDIWLFGGANLLQAFLNLQLVDELWLSVHPLLLGSGTLLFSEMGQRIPLSLLEVRHYDSGLVSIKYHVDNVPGK